MAINKKLIHFQTMANFEAQLSAGNILDTSIVFIKDAKNIWTHGQFYDCSPTDLSEYATVTELNKKQDKLVSGTSIKTINNTSLLGRGNITVATQAYVDSKIGDINTILESIIGGGSYYYGLAQYSEEELLNIVDEALEE